MRLHLITRDIGGESPHVGPGIRVRRAELALVEITERILGRARGVVAGAVGMEEDRPGMHRQPTDCRGPAGLAQNIALARERTHGRLHEPLVVEPRLRGEEMRAPLLQDDAMNRVVREDVASCVVDECRRHATEPGSQLEVVENRLDALSGKVAGEEEAGCLEHACPTSLRPLPLPWRPACARVRAAAAASR